MKKYFNYVIVILFMICFIISPVNITADSGFDSDYDYDSGGSWDSDYDWDYDYDYDSDYNYHYSSGESENLDTIDYVCAVLLLILYIVFMRITMSKIRNRYKNRRDQEEINSKNLTEITDIELKEKLFSIYKEVQIAWMNLDLSPVRNLLTDEMYNMYEMQLATLKNKNQKNIMEDIKLIDVKLISSNMVNGKEELKVMLEVTCRDYIIDVTTNSVVRGNENIINKYTYQLTFIKNNNIIKTKCPNCGGELDSNGSKCQYCRSTIVHETSDYVLSRKRMLYQSRK